MKMTMKAAENASIEMTAGVKVKNKADAIALNDLTNYTLADDEIEIEEIPDSITD